MDHPLTLIMSNHPNGDIICLRFSGCDKGLLESLKCSTLVLVLSILA